MRLLVQGPGPEIATHEFGDVVECMKRQAEIEQHLLASGYQLPGPPADRRDETRDMERSRSSPSDGLTMASSGQAKPSMYDTLFWSKRGAVACRVHAPDPQSDRWHIEHWCPIPGEASTRHGLAYQCPRCAPDGRMHRHLNAAEHGENDAARSA